MAAKGKSGGSGKAAGGRGSPGKGTVTQRIGSPNAAGGWRVDAPGGKRASAVEPTKKAAEQRAKEIVRRDGGGEVRTRNSAGQFVDSDTVKPGNDPNPPRDRKH